MLSPIKVGMVAKPKLAYMAGLLTTHPKAEKHNSR
jgi:hypothetical protein